MRLKHLVILQTACILGFAVFAHGSYQRRTCVERRLDAKGEALEKIPAIDMSNKTDLCYAINAEQMADAYYASTHMLPENHLTAVVPVASFFSSKHRKMINEITGDSKNDGFNMGDPRLAYNVIRERGSCSAHDVFADHFDAVFWKVATLQSAYKEFRKGKSSQDILKELKDMDFSKSSLQALGNLEFLSGQESFISFSDKILQKACSQNMLPMPNLPNLRLIEISPTSLAGQTRPDFLLSAVQRNINERGLPFIINVCKKALYDSNINQLNEDGTPDKQCHPHAGLVVGVDRDCKILVRNTQICDKTQGLGNQCEDQQTWIWPEDLSRNTMGFFEFK